MNLLEVGSSTVSKLVKKTGLHRSYIYDILNKLIDFGLATFITKNNKKYFEVSDPSNILNSLDSKEQEIKLNKEKLSKIIPLLIKNQNKSLETQQAKIFLGKKGIKSLLEDILNTNEDFITFGAEGKFREIFKWYFTNWQKRRVKDKIRYKVIYNIKLKGKRPTKEQKLVQKKFLPEKYEFPATTEVYKNKTIIIIWDKEPIAFLIESRKVAKTFKNYFGLLWGLAK